jgi:hypothetical protein
VKEVWMRTYSFLLVFCVIMSSVIIPSCNMNSVENNNKKKQKPLAVEKTGQNNPQQQVPGKQRDSKDKNDPDKKAARELTELFQARKFDEILEKADDIFPDAGFRSRATVYIMKGQIDKALSEFDLDVLKSRGYPDNIQNGYYKGWNSLSIEKGLLYVKDRTDKVLAQFNLFKFIPGKLSKIWTLKEMGIMRQLISNFEANHPYCCLMKFLIEGYSPNDIYRLIELDLLKDNFQQVNKRLNLLRLIDWEASFTEVEFLSVTALLLQNDLRAAREFVYADSAHSPLRYDDAIDTFIELSVNFDTKKFDGLKSKFAESINNYKVEEPYNLYDSWFEMPALEKWLSTLKDSPRTFFLREAWVDLKAKHGMADLYSYMYR